MSHGNNHNVLKDGNKRMDRERIEMKHQNEDDYSTLNDFKSNRQQPLQSTGHKSTKNRCCRSVIVCLVLLCVFLLTAVIVLCVNRQWHKTKNELSKTLSEADGWVYYQYSFYYISSMQKSWSDSRKFCKERGSNLTIVNTSHEQDFITKITGGDQLWIGLSDSDEEGVWKWVDGSTLNSVFWASREPNSVIGDEDCVLTESKGWSDFPCTDAFKWICEKKLLKL